MKKNIKKLIALFLCLCVFGSGISVSATDTASPDTTQTTEPSTDSSGIETTPTTPSTGETDTDTGSDTDSTTTPSDGTNTDSTTDDTAGTTDSGSTSSGDTSSDSTTTPATPVVKPLTLSGKLSATRTAQLKWNADDTSATYKLYRATKKTGKYSVVTTITGKNGTVTYNNKKLTLGKTYYYQVKKFKGGKTVDKK